MSLSSPSTRPGHSTSTRPCTWAHPSGFLLRYAIADVAAFVTPGGALDKETRTRAVTLYAPDKRTPLHPFSLSEGNGSLLAGEDRPAVVWSLPSTSTER